MDLEHFDESVKHDVESGMIPMIKQVGTRINTTHFAACLPYYLPYSLSTHLRWEHLPYPSQAYDMVAKRGLKLSLYASPWSPPAWMKLRVPACRKRHPGGATAHHPQRGTGGL